MTDTTLHGEATEARTGGAVGLADGSDAGAVDVPAVEAVEPTPAGGPDPDTSSRQVANGGLLGLVRNVWTDRVGASLLVLAAVGFSLSASNYWIFVGTLGLLLGVAAIGLLILVGWAREISLAQAGLTGMSLYLTGYAHRSVDGWGLSYPAAAAVGIGAAVLVSVLIALAALRLAGIYVMVLTLAVQFLIENTVFASGQLSGGLSPQPTPRPDFFGVSLASDRAFYFYVLAWVVGVVVLVNRLRTSKFGRGLILVGTDRQAAAVVGISPWRYKILAFALCGAMAGLAGALLAPLFRTPPGTFQYFSVNSLFYLAIPILAGFTSITGVVVVALVFTFLPEALEAYRISPFLLGGIGLAIGTIMGPRGAILPIKRRIDRLLGGPRLRASRAPIPARFRAAAERGGRS